MTNSVNNCLSQSKYCERRPCTLHISTTRLPFATGMEEYGAAAGNCVRMHGDGKLFRTYSRLQPKRLECDRSAPHIHCCPLHPLELRCRKCLCVPML
eukprot:3812657-Amphidinium_carterae.1